MGDGSFKTKSEICDYSTGNGGCAPKYGVHGSTDSIQHKLQAPKGEKPLRYNDAAEPKHSKSGSNYSGPATGSKAGKTAYPGFEAKKGAGGSANRGVARGVPTRDRFNAPGQIGSSFGKKHMKKVSPYDV
jgi:hypothetical protein